jgi:hypothetical protein
MFYGAHTTRPTAFQITFFNTVQEEENKLLPFISIYDWQKYCKISYKKGGKRYEEKKSHKSSVRCSTDACGTPIWFTAPLAWVPHMSFEEKTQ